MNLPQPENTSSGAPAGGAEIPSPLPLQTDDPARNHLADIDPAFVSRLPGWHRALGGGTHVTGEERERLEADILLARKEDRA